jgi:uncharacterized protein YdbL (DUF1318 family)
MADWNRIGRALGGFAAGYGGSGGQYLETLQRADEMRLLEEERKRKESEKRQGNTQQRTANAIRLARQRMEQNPVAALPLINEMLMNIPGADRSPLGQIKQSILTSQTTGVLAPGQKEQILGQAGQQLRALEDSFVTRGLLQPEQSEKPVALASGSQLVDPRTGQVVAENTGNDERERRVINGPDGIPRYADTGEPVFPSVAKPPESREGLITEHRRVARDIYKNFNEVQTAYDRLASVGAEGTPASDLALIFNYMKLLDPASVVRESEFTTAEQARGWFTSLDEESRSRVPAVFVQMFNRADGKGTLLPEQREDFLRRAESLANSAINQADEQFAYLLDQTEADGLAGESVFGKRLVEGYLSRQAERQRLAAQAEAARQAAQREILTNAPQAPAAPQVMPNGRPPLTAGQSYLDLVEQERRRQNAGNR